MSKKVSIVTINYNHSSGLNKTMKSVLCQTYNNIEYIVIDGGSTDGSLELIETHKEKLSYWCSEKDDGIYNAMNKGLSKATGDYLLFLNSGDFFSSNHIIQDVFCIEHSSDLLIGRQLHIDKNGKISKSPKLHAEDLNMAFFLSSTLPHQSTFISKRLIESIGGYDENYKVSADWVFWIKAVIIHHCSTEFLSQSISYMESGGVSNDMNKCHADMAIFLEKLLHQNVLTWNDIFNQALKARGQEFCCRNSLLRFFNKIIMKIGKNC